MNPSEKYSRIDELAEDFAARFRRGERPTYKEYIDRHPELAEEIRELFPALVEMEHAELASEIVGPSLPLPRHIGDYRIIREVGRGGMGVVFEAEQQSLGRRVALKVMPARNTRDHAALERFKREARTAAQLHHTNIVPVFEVGQDRETCFYAMQFIQGQGLDQVIVELCRLRSDASRETDRPSRAVNRETPPEATAAGQLAASMLTGRFSIDLTTAYDDLGCRADPSPTPADGAGTYSAMLPGQTDRSSVHSGHGHYFRSASRIGEQAAAALSYAHQRGIVHRDIKPSNLLLDTAGTVWITDFGLAKADDDGLTQSGDVLGTFRYMAPERFAGLCDARSDIFSLGLSLYELLTLRPAFDSPDRLRLIEQVKQGQAPRPRSVDPRIPRDLETIVLKAIDREPKRRYQSAGELSDDLRHFLAGEPIKARRTGELERLRHWCRRNPTVAAMVGTVAILLTVLAIGATLSAIWLRDDRDLAVGNEQRAVTAEKTASTAKREALAKLWDSSLVAARAGRMSRSPGQRFGSLRAIEQALALPLPLGRSKDELRTEAIASLLLPDLEVAKEWPGWPAGSRGLAIDSSFQRYARGDADGNVSVCRIADDKELFRLPGAGPAQDNHEPLAFSPDGRYLSQMFESGQNRIWRLESRKPAIVLAGDFTTCGFSPDSRQVAAAFPDDSIRFFELADGRELKRFPCPNFQPFQLAWNPRRPLLAAVNRASVRLIDVDTGNWQTEFSDRDGISWSAWHPEGRLIAVGTDESVPHSRIAMWDTIARQLTMPPLEGHKSLGVFMQFNRTGDRLISSDWSHVWRLWDAHRGELLLTQSAGGNGVWFSQDDQFVGLDASGSHLRMFRFRSGDELCTIVHRGQSPIGGFRNRALYPIDSEGRLLAIHAATGFAVVDLVRGEEVGFASLGDTVGDNIPFATDGSGGLLTHGKRGLFRWPLMARAGQRVYGPAEILAPNMTSVIGEPGASADGQVLAFPKRDEGARELLLPEGKQVTLQKQEDKQEDVRHCAVSPNGLWIATGSHNALKIPGASVWNARTGRHVCDLPVREYCQVSFSPGGKWLVTDDRGIRLWSVGAWKEGPALASSTGGTAFTADDSLVAIPGAPGVVRIVVAESGRELAWLTAPDASALSPLCFTRDGARLVCYATGTESLLIFNLPRIRGQLAAMGLDWDAPPNAVAMSSHPDAIEIEFIDDKSPAAARAKERQIDEQALAVMLDPLNAETRLRLGVLLCNKGNLENADQQLRFALALRSDLADARSWQLRMALAACGSWHVRHERWKRAAADYVLLADIQPNVSETGLQAAALRSTAGDRAGYREFCRRMLQRFHDTTNPNDAERTAKACLITDELKAELPEVSRLAQFAARKGANSGYRLWFELAAGMAEYRQQKYAAALERFERNHKSTAGLPVVDELNSLFEALTLHNLGRTTEARRLFDSTSSAVTPQRFGRNADDLNWDWHDWLIARIVCEEARRLLSETPATAK